MNRRRDGVHRENMGIVHKYLCDTVLNYDALATSPLSRVLQHVSQ
jgi:hypothetical protein